jgi:hypothetical protein
MPEQNQSKDAPGNEGLTPQQPTATLPKVEVKEGKVLVDGKSYVKESDLIAAKESLQKQLDSAQSVHNEAVDKLRLEVSAGQTEVAKANAALIEANKARTAGGISAEELSKFKKEAEDAKAALVGIQTASLDNRRKYLMAAYNIPANSDVAKKLQEKDAGQLDSFEEALKALSTSRGGPGNYAVGAGGGGSAPVSDMDRAKTILANTPYRGVRNEPANK